MNSFSMAFDNFKRNIKTYALYIIAMIFSVLVYYNFIALKYNPDFEKAKGTTEYIKGISTTVSFLLLIFIIFFIWFSSSFFLNQRKKEIGIYAFMGVTNSEIASIYAIEVLFIGITAITVGLFLGIIFCKLFLMLLAKVAILNMKIKFFISTKAIIETALTFFAIFFINSILGYINIVKSKLIDLFNASKREEQLPKVNYIKGLLSIVLIGIGYYFAKHSIGEKFVIYIPLAVLFVIMGTYWLFGATYSIIMKYVLSKKKLLYNGVNIVSISNIAFRIKNNYRTLTAVAVLIAVTLTSYGTVASLKYFVQISDYIQTPYSISYISNDESTKKQVRDKIRENKNNILLEENTKFLVIKPHMQTKFNLPDSETAALKYSDFVRISSDLKAKDLKKINACPLQKNEVIYVDIPTVIMSLIDYDNKNATINNKKYTIKNNFKTPLFGIGVPLSCFILNDNDYNDLKNIAKEYEFNGININNTSDIKAISADLKKIDSIKDTLYTNVGKDKSTYNIIGIIYFLGAFLSLVFIIATGSIIYFKLVSEAYMDKDKYRILKRLGMTNKEAHKAVSKQIAISYIMPLVVGIIHSCVAMTVLSDFMHYNIIVPAITSILTFIVVYIIYFIGTTRKYLKIVM